RQFINRQKPKGGQRDVQSSGNVAFGEDETVSLRIIDGLRGDVEDGAVQRRENVDSREVAANVAGARVVHQLEILDTDLPRRLGNVRDLLIAMPLRRPG